MKFSKPVAGIALLGFVLVWVQYLHHRSLWLDESLLALNIIDRSYGALLTPLENNQVAPILFLWAERLATDLIGKSEWSLRLFPLLCSMVSIILFYPFVQKTTRNKATALLAFSLFCLSPSLVYFASEVKQYASDVLVLLLNYAVLLYPFQPNSRFWAPALIAAGVVSVFFSNIAVIVLFTTGLLLALRNFKASVPILAAWVTAFCSYYYFFIGGHPHRSEMLDYWQKAFPPHNPFSSEFAVWAAQKVKMIFTGILAFPEEYLLFVPFAGVWLLAIFRLFKNRNFVLLHLLIFPVAVHFALACLRLYPFDHRLILYQTPLFIIGIAIGFYHLHTKWTARWPLLRFPVFLLLPPLIYLFQLLRDFPAEREEIRPCIAFINEYIAPADHLYIFYGAEKPFLYYRKTGFCRFGNPAVFGKKHPGEPTAFESELAGFQGKTWVLFSHLNPFGTQAEADSILSHLAGKGELLREYEAKGAAVYLFEL